VALEYATFVYGANMRPALDAVSFSVERGSIVAVVGAVASGKSTLLRVLAGLLPPQKGACVYNERRIGAWDWPAIRARIGYVPQESLLFSESIEDNVVLGRDVDPAFVRSCLETAQLGDGLERLELSATTMLGHGGTRVSGGQKQRIATARALAGRPEVLLLDDCTSSLDARNEERLWESIKQNCAGVTVFCVSHRPTTIRRADVILVLDGGRLVGSGTHEQLSRDCREYREFLTVEERRSHIEEWRHDTTGGPGA
jgi:ATP-binding cassette subfamily B protein